MFDLLTQGAAIIETRALPRPGAFAGGRWGAGDAPAPAPQHPGTLAGGRWSGAVGASMFQTPGAQSREMEQIDSDMRLFSAELTQAAKERGYDVHDPMSETNEQSTDQMLMRARDAAKPVPNDKIVKFFAATWYPFARQWSAYYRTYGDGRWWSNPAAEAEGMQRQLVTMRETAKMLGLGLTSPTPEPFSKSFLDPHHDVGDTIRDKSDEVWKLLKIGAYGALGLGVLFGGTMIYQNLRKK